MSLWSTLAKIGGVVAAPFSGGASLALEGIGTGLDALGQMGQGAAAGRQGQDQANLQRDMVALNAQNERQRALLDAAQLKSQDQINRGNLDLAQRKFAQDALTTRGRQSVLGDVLKNIQPVSVNRPSGVANIHFSGGLSPALLGPNSRAAGDEMGRQALLSMMQGEHFDPLVAADPTVLPQFQMTPQSQPSLWEKMANIAGIVGGGLDSLNAIKGGRKVVPTMTKRRPMDERLPDEAD